ncbi:hypothetical protein [Aureimonas sp. AU40]|uniref:hypothetical protein n=1 Tax=Aureimonas sp. AU40 TaxID=1637747 RepID=UPI000780C58B|nr:hypothetical protein [Aureimonas sp. AU40]
MSQPSAVSLSLVLERIGQELSRQAEAVRSLHALVEAGSGPSTEALVTAQAIDTSSQHLGELSGLLQCLSGSAGDAFAPASCFEPMTLSGLRARLLGDAEENTESGEVDFF